MASLPEPGPLAPLFRLDPGTVYLNHGSFGACPTPVVEAQARLRDQMEADAVRFFVRDMWGLMDRARAALSPVVGAPPDGLVFVPNATTGVTTVLHNLRLGPGDEILVTSNEYTACVNNCKAAAARAGATVVTAPLPWPVPGPDAVVDAVLAHAGPRTRVALVSLVTSATGLRLPVERLIPALRDRGVPVLLDAAHGPGCVPMDLAALAPDWATGNCHKWLFAPKGAAFLYIAEPRRAGFRPLVLSNDAERLAEASARSNRPAWQHEFDYTGTDDLTARMAVADAAAFLETAVPGGRDALMSANRAMALAGRDLVCGRLGIEPPAPDSMIGPMCALRLPSGEDPLALGGRLYERHRIQIPVWAGPGGTLIVRLSAQVYNSPAQYAHLADALAAELKP